jgi:sigma-E factor negative regulatory protein RseA
MHATISVVESDPRLADAWERYHLVRAALRGVAVQHSYRDIAVRVRGELEFEPVPMVARAGRGERSHRFGPFVGAALAASAAFLAVFAVPQLFDPDRRTVSSVESPAVADLPVQFRLEQPGRRWHLDQPGLEYKLDSLLVNHQAYSPSSGFKGFLPYATVVGYDAGQ